MTDILITPQRRALVRQQSHESDVLQGDARPPRTPRGAELSGLPHIQAGLTIAGVGCAILTTVYDLFSVDTFLTAYQIDAATYAYASLALSSLNTANSLLGAYGVDRAALTMPRTDLVGVTGCLFCFALLAPFFRVSWLQPGVHLVAANALYDTCNNLTSILIGSVVTDDHQLTDRQRVQFMASGRLLSLVCSLAVGRLGLATFLAQDLTQFRFFLLTLALVVAILFLVAQVVILGDAIQWTRCRRRTRNRRHAPVAAAAPPLEFQSVIQDFWSSRNFCMWLGMEVLLEVQLDFVSRFLKTFVDGLLPDTSTSDWWLSLVRPCRDIATIVVYIPIRVYGYPAMYASLFFFNILLVLLYFMLGGADSTMAVTLFILLYPVMTGAVQAAGFHLALSDVALELKRNHALAGRVDEPSSAALLVGATALLAKPLGALLPIVTATALDKYGDRSLSPLLVVPPLVFGVVQLVCWSRFTLHPKWTATMRDELNRVHDELAYFM